MEADKESDEDRNGKIKRLVVGLLQVFMAS